MPKVKSEPVEAAESGAQSVAKPTADEMTDSVAAAADVAEPAAEVAEPKVVAEPAAEPEVAEPAAATEVAEPAAEPEVAEPAAATEVAEPAAATEDAQPSAAAEPAEDSAPVLEAEEVEEAPETPAVEDSAVEDSAVEDSAVEDSAVEDSAVERVAAVPAPRRRVSRRTLVTAGLAVLLAALWGVGGWLFVHNRGTGQLADHNAAALAAAQKVATDLTSITAQNAQTQIQSLTAESTGGFRDQISTYASALQAILQQAQAGSRGTVSAGGIERIDATTASALVTVSAVVSNSKLPSGQPVSYRLGVQLQREGDQWLASNVNFVP